MAEAMPEEEAEDLVDWLDELFAVNSDPDTDLDGDDDEVAEPWDLMEDYDLDGEDEGDEGEKEE
jgi:hypothetical protein